jgi:hypothetical protein
MHKDIASLKATSPERPSELVRNFNSVHRKSSTRQTKMIVNLPYSYRQPISFTQLLKKEFKQMGQNIDLPLKEIKPKRKRKKARVLTAQERKEWDLRVTARKKAALEKKRIAQEREKKILSNILEDKPVGYNVTGERGLICAIFVQALNDMLLCPHPDITKEHNNESQETYSIEAAQFINSENEIFRIYCDLLDVDPVRMEKYLFKFFKKQLIMKSKKKDTNYEIPSFINCEPPILSSQSLNIFN